MPLLDTKKDWYLLEEKQHFSQSQLWDMQRHYFAGRGAAAWRHGEVPYYITSNPTIACAYAEIVFAFLQDQQRHSHSSEPLYICELGAGAGQFCFLFLDRLHSLCQESGVSPGFFRYILTDFTQSNLDAWLQHPRFQPFFRSGLLDIALFDVSRSTELALQLGGHTLAAGALRRPLAVIANYLFDSVPHDLFYFKDQVAHHCLVSLATAEDPEIMDVAELLAKLFTHYDCQPLLECPYPEAALRELWNFYRRELSDAYLFFPAASIRCLQRLKSLSQSGLLLLSADKGDHSLGQVARKSPPELICHGSFSFRVNYHAFREFCLQSGGAALIQKHQHQNIEVIGLLMVDNADDCTATQRAYQIHVGEFSPDDFYTLSNSFIKHLPEMQTKEILAYLRFAQYDALQLSRMMPRLMELAPDLSAQETLALKSAIDQTWKGYFSIQEERDLAFDIASFFYALNDFATALIYFQRTQNIYGTHTGTLYNMAVCHDLLNQPLQAMPLLHELLRTDPDNEAARALLDRLTGEDGCAKS